MAEKGTELVEIYSSPTELQACKDINDFRIKLQEFEKKMDEAPVKTLKHKEGFEYVPIGALEHDFKKFFFGLWEWHITGDPIIVVNEIVVRGKIRAFHPVAGIWIERSGIGASQIRMAKGSQLTDINSKLKTALQMDAPHAETQAFKNAAQKFGKRFGGGLRRDFTMDYEGFNIRPTDIALTEDQQAIYDEVVITINEYQDAGELSGNTVSILDVDLPKEIIAQLRKTIQTKFDALKGAENGK